jgi:hypothetical protein
MRGDENEKIKICKGKKLIFGVEFIKKHKI